MCIIHNPDIYYLTVTAFYPSTEHKNSSDLVKGSVTQQELEAEAARKTLDKHLQEIIDVVKDHISLVEYLYHAGLVTQSVLEVRDTGVYDSFHTKTIIFNSVRTSIITNSAKFEDFLGLLHDILPPEAVHIVKNMKETYRLGKFGVR